MEQVTMRFLSGNSNDNKTEPMGFSWYAESDTGETQVELGYTMGMWRCICGKEASEAVIGEFGHCGCQWEGDVKEDGITGQLMLF